ncbi:MAG TPA: DUF885 domain-containing protein [Gemmataceae bacterium]
MNHRTRPSAFALATLWAVLGMAAAHADEDARLEAFFRNYLEEEFKHRPLEATRLGDHRYDDRLDDLSPDALKANAERARRALADLKKTIRYDKLSRPGQIDYEILARHIEYGLWVNENTRPYETDPRLYNTCISDSVFLLLTQSTLPKAGNIRNAASRIRQIPRVVAAARQNLKDPPRVLVEVALRQNRGSIAFYEKGIFEMTGETPQVSELAGPCREAVRCLKEYQTFLEEDLLPKAGGDWRLGREKFYRKLELELNAGLTADQVLADAEAEARRVRGEMYVIARQLWSRTFPGEPLPPDDPEGRRETIRRVLGELNKDHGRPEDLVEDARATVQRIKDFIREKDILKLPEPDRCRIVEMPEFQRGFSVAYLNAAPPLDAAADSVYAVSPPPSEWDDRRVASFMQEYNRSMLQILTIHEAYPGHYVQLEYSNRCPSLVRKVLPSGVFAEGWAVYTEQMMLDQGYGDGDLAMRLHQLKWYLRAVTNAILDHKMHCTDMSDAEALDLLVNGAFQEEGEAVGKILRAKQSSCQLSTYFVGRMAFYRLRQKVQRERGERFDLGRFHEAVLSHGSPPVKYLPELVRE